MTSQKSDQIVAKFFSFSCVSKYERTYTRKIIMIHAKWRNAVLRREKRHWNTWFDLSGIDTWEKSCRSADKAPGDIRQWTRNKRSVGGKEDREGGEKRSDAMKNTQIHYYVLSATRKRMQSSIFTCWILFIQFYYTRRKRKRETKKIVLVRLILFNVITYKNWLLQN